MADLIQTFLLNLRQVWHEWKTKDWLPAELLREMFPALKKRLER